MKDKAKTKRVVTVIEPSKEITNNDSDIELKPNNKKDESWVITAIEQHNIIKEYWTLDNYLAVKLLEVIETAVAPDNKWVLHTDYRTRLRTMETLLKLKDKNFGWNWVHVNFFSSPSKLRY